MLDFFLFFRKEKHLLRKESFSRKEVSGMCPLYIRYVSTIVYYVSTIVHYALYAFLHPPSCRPVFSESAHPAPNPDVLRLFDDFSITACGKMLILEFFLYGFQLHILYALGGTHQRRRTNQPCQLIHSEKHLSISCSGSISQQMP